MLSGCDYDKNDGIRLGIGNGNWYLFYDKRTDFYKKHHFNERRSINGIKYWRNFGRLVFIKDVSFKERHLLCDTTRIVERDAHGNLKRMIIKHT